MTSHVEQNPELIPYTPKDLALIAAVQTYLSGMYKEQPLSKGEQEQKKHWISVIRVRFEDFIHHTREENGVTKENKKRLPSEIESRLKVVRAVIKLFSHQSIYNLSIEKMKRLEDLTYALSLSNEDEVAIPVKRYSQELKDIVQICTPYDSSQISSALNGIAQR
jgi:hypothetical protein